MSDGRSTRDMIEQGRKWALERYGDVGGLGEGVPYDRGGMIPPGNTWVRNDTGRPLGPDEWHLLTPCNPPEGKVN